MTPSESSWIQVNCHLIRTGQIDRPTFPWRGLADALHAWRSEGRLERFFFVRKPPGLRLRFQGPEPGDLLVPQLTEWLEDAERRERIEGFHFVVYEPEVFRFGGERGMDLAHDRFDLDAGSALAYESLDPDDRAALSRPLCSLALNNALFAACVDDAPELWDIWKGLGAQVGRRPAESVAQPGDLEGAGAMMLTPAFLSSLPVAGRTLVTTSVERLQALTPIVRSAFGSGQVSIGPRAWCRATTIFQWNQLGIGPDDALRVASAAIAFLERHSRDHP